MFGKSENVFCKIIKNILFGNKKFQLEFDFNRKITNFI
jgi:hypothetical protein